MPLHPKIEEAERKLSDAITELEEFIEKGDRESTERTLLNVWELESRAEEAHRLYGEGK